MASFSQNTDVNWLACSSMPLMCASIPVSQTPTHFSNRTKRSIHGNRSHAADLTSMIRHTSRLRRRTRSMKWYLGLSARPSFRLSSLFLHQRSQTPPWENNHEAVYRKIMLYSFTIPTSPTSQTSHTVCSPHTSIPFSLLPSYLKYEKSVLVHSLVSPSAILTVLRNLVWDLAMQVVT